MLESDDGWWQASDGNWYPPELRPRPAEHPPIPEPAPELEPAPVLALHEVLPVIPEPSPLARLAAEPAGMSVRVSEVATAPRDRVTSTTRHAHAPAERSPFAHAAAALVSALLLGSSAFAIGSVIAFLTSDDPVAPPAIANVDVAGLTVDPETINQPG